MRKLIKKTVALTAAFAMTLSVSAVAGAESPTSGTLDTDSQLEGFVDKNVYDITVPTVTDGGLDFTVDPQGLLKVADKDTYTLGEGAVYFTNAGETDTYSNTSDAIELYNNSSFDIDVSLDIEVTASDAGITLVEEADLEEATNPSLYLGLIVDSKDPVAITDETYAAEAVTLTAVPEKTADAEGYEIKASETSDDENAVASPNGYYYTYELSSGYDKEDSQKVSFKLEAACDSTADWSAVTTNVLSADLVWTVEADELVVPDAAPSIATTAVYNCTEGTGSIDVSLGTGALETTISSVKYGGSATPTLDCEYTYEDGKINYSIANWANQAGTTKYVLVTLADESSQLVTIMLE